MVKILQTEAITAYRALELFGTFFPSNEKTPVGDKHAAIILAVILHFYIVGVRREILLSYKVPVQKITVSIRTRNLEFFYQLSRMFHNQRVSSRNYSIAFGGGYKI